MSLLNVCTSGVYIIGAANNETENMMTASLVLPASFTPPCITISFDQNRFTKNIILETGKFSVSVLAKNQVEIAKRFGFTSGKDNDKLKGFEGYSMKSRLPVINDCTAWLICDVRSKMNLGDHLVIGGEVMRAEYYKAEPLIYDNDTFF